MKPNQTKPISGCEAPVLKHWKVWIQLNVILIEIICPCLIERFKLFFITARKYQVFKWKISNNWSVGDKWPSWNHHILIILMFLFGISYPTLAKQLYRQTVNQVPGCVMASSHHQWTLGLVMTDIKGSLMENLIRWMWETVTQKLGRFEKGQLKEWLIFWGYQGQFFYQLKNTLHISLILRLIQREVETQ